VAAAGALGAGIDARSLDEAMSAEPHFVACDAGTTDAGPYSLGTGCPAFAREAVRADLETMLCGTRDAGIPVIIGSAGTAGADVHVDWTVGIVQDIVQATGRSLRAAVIYAEQDKDRLLSLLAQGRILPLDAAPAIDERTIKRSERIVGMMSVEQLQGALEQGVDIVIAGRCSDAALYAALPIKMGFPKGLSWHAGKVMECGTMAAVRRDRDGSVGNSGPTQYNRGVLLGTVTHYDARITAIGPGLACTPASVAGHSLYENGDPFLFAESAGVFDLTRSTYESADGQTVRIAGSAFHPGERYTIKLEGAELAGYASVIVGGIRDPFIIRQLDDWVQRALASIRSKVSHLLSHVLSKEDYKLAVHVYGRDAVMGAAEPGSVLPPHEVGLVLEVLAPTQELATTIAQISRQPLLHNPVPGWSGGVTTFAFLHNPAHLERGPVYEFNLNHIALPDTTDELFRTEIIDLVPGADRLPVTTT